MSLLSGDATRPGAEEASTFDPKPPPVAEHPQHQHPTPAVARRQAFSWTTCKGGAKVRQNKGGRHVRTRQDLRVQTNWRGAI